MTLLQTLHARLEAVAYKVTDNFCYSCYKVVEAEYCPNCHSDDFMCHLKGVGVEYGTDWVIEHLIPEHCEAIDSEDQFEEQLNEICETVKIGSLEYDPGYVLKELDPTAFRIGASEMLDDLDNYSEVDGQYYNNYDIETMIDELSA